MSGQALPEVVGERLALVVGHTLAPGTFHDARPVDVDDPVSGRTVRLLDTGDALVLFRHGLPEVSDPPFTPAHLVDHHLHVRALARAGVARVLALASVGSLRTDWHVGTIVAPHDFLALGIAPTFHADAAGHTVPGFDAAWRTTVIGLWREVSSAPLVDGGVYAQTPGPRFETPAEVRLLATFADIVGMSLAGECILAKEAGLRYAAVCVIDNLANGLGRRPLTVEEFRAGKAANEAVVGPAVAALLPRLAKETE